MPLVLPALGQRSLPSRGEAGGAARLARGCRQTVGSRAQTLRTDQGSAPHVAARDCAEEAALAPGLPYDEQMKEESQKPRLWSLLYRLPEIPAAVVLASAAPKRFHLLPEQGHKRLKNLLG